MRVERKANPCVLLVELYLHWVLIENNMAFLQNNPNISVTAPGPINPSSESMYKGNEVTFSILS